MRLILASRSTTRRAMLEAAGVAFETADAELDEEAAKAGLIGAGFDPRGIAEELARLKAMSVTAAQGNLVLGCDQVLDRGDGTILGKPHSLADARDQLRTLSGTTHQLHSAAVIIEDGEAIWWQTETATMTMRPLGDAFLETYLARKYDAIRGNVGCYRIEGLGAQLFDRVEGSHFAILGLPLLPLLAYLRERGVLAS